MISKAIVIALLRTFRASGRLSTIFGLFLGIIISFALAAYIEAGYWRSVLIEIGAACMLFLLLSRLFQAEPSKIHTITLLTVGGGLLTAAWSIQDDYWQSIFIELGAGAILFLFLELYIDSFLNQIRNDEPEFFQIALLAEAVKDDEGELAQTFREHDVEPIVALRMLTSGVPCTIEDICEASEEFNSSSIGAPWAIEDPEWIASWENAFEENKSPPSDASTRD